MLLLTQFGAWQPLFLLIFIILKRPARLFFKKSYVLHYSWTTPQRKEVNLDHIKHRPLRAACLIPFHCIKAFWCGLVEKKYRWSKASEADSAKNSSATSPEMERRRKRSRNTCSSFISGSRRPSRSMRPISDSWWRGVRRWGSSTLTYW